MYRIVLILTAVISTSILAQGQSAPSATLPASTTQPPATVVTDIVQLRLLVEKSNASNQATSLKQSLQAVSDRVKQLKIQDPNNSQLVDLIELRILVSPIVELVKKGIPASVEGCNETQHEIQFMEGFSEQEGREIKDGEEAQMLLKLFCPNIKIESK